MRTNQNQLEEMYLRQRWIERSEQLAKNMISVAFNWFNNRINITWLFMLLLWDGVIPLMWITVLFAGVVYGLDFMPDTFMSIIPVICQWVKLLRIFIHLLSTICSRLNSAQQTHFSFSFIVNHTWGHKDRHRIIIVLNHAIQTVLLLLLLLWLSRQGNKIAEKMYCVFNGLTIEWFMWITMKSVDINHRFICYELKRKFAITITRW